MLKVTFVVILNTLLVLSVIFIVLMFLYQTFIKPNNCKPTITTANGFAAERDICSGGLIFEENFDELDKLVWRPDVTLDGGGVSTEPFINRLKTLSETKTDTTHTPRKKE